MRRSALFCLLALALAPCTTTSSARATGTWTKAPPNPKTRGQAFGLWLLTDGDGGVLLHDVGTCVTTGPSLDVDHADIEGHARGACAFDTPQLRGLSDSAPYLHDGSATSLADVVPIMLRASAPPGEEQETLSDDDLAALVEYLRGL